MNQHAIENQQKTHLKQASETREKNAVDLFVGLNPEKQSPTLGEKQGNKPISIRGKEEISPRTDLKVSDAQRIVSLPYIETPEDFKAEWTYSDSTEIKKDLKQCPKPVANPQIWAWSNNKDGDSSSDLTTRLNQLNGRETSETEVTESKIVVPWIENDPTNKADGRLPPGNYGCISMTISYNRPSFNELKHNVNRVVDTTVSHADPFLEWNNNGLPMQIYRGGAFVLILVNLGRNLWRGFQGKPMDLPVSWLTLAFGLSLFSVLSTRLALGIPIALIFEAWFVYQKTNKVNVVKYATDFGLVFLFLTLPTCFPVFAVKNAALIHKTSTLVSTALSSHFYVKVVQTTVENKPPKNQVVSTTVRFTGWLKESLFISASWQFKGMCTLIFCKMACASRYNVT